MKKRGFPLLVILGLFLMFLTSCKKHEVSPMQPTSLDMEEILYQDTSVLLSESEDSLSSAFSAKWDMAVTERKGITYGFDPAIAPKDRADCILATENILSRIGAEKNIQLYICTAESYDSTFVRENGVYTHLQDWDSPEYISALLYGLFGEYCNYGMVYGYANYLCEDLYGIPMDICAQDWVYTGDPNTLDLNLLCFRPEFVGEEVIPEIGKLANSFVADCIEEKGEAEFRKLLESSGNLQTVHSFVEVLADYYADRNLDYTPSDMLYRIGGKSYDYIVKCPYATMYVEKDWLDENRDLCPYTYEGFLHQNYTDTQLFFQTNADQMENYQRLFGLDSYNDDLNIYFSNTATNASTYVQQLHAIFLRNTGSLTHEYIHSLTVDKSMQEPWAVEGFARYFSYRYDYYGNAMSNADYNAVPDTANYQYIHDYRDSIGRDIDVTEDIEALLHIATYVNGYNSPNDGDGYTPGASFVAYLISRLGQEKVIEIICTTHDFGEYSYGELVADWQAFLEQNYGTYEKL